MLGLKNYLEEGPKSWLAKIHKKYQKTKGLVQGSKVLSAMESWALNPERIQTALKELSALEQQVITRIYFSEERGVLESDLYSASKDKEPSQLSECLHNLDKKMLIYSRKGEHYSFHGFRELLEPILDYSLPKGLKALDNPENPQSHRNFLIPHFIHFIASIFLGKLKCTQKSGLSRRSVQMLRDNFTASEMLSPQVSALEVDMYLQFCIDRNFILDDGIRLHLSREGLEFLTLEMHEINRALVEWWLRKRLCNSRKIIEILEKQFPNGVQLDEMLPLWSSFSPLKSPTGLQTKGGVSWENLPEVLKEIWILGGCGFYLKQGKLWGAKFSSQFLTEYMSPDSNESLSYSLPNFEVLLSHEAPPHRRFQLESLAQRQNDEAMCSYSLSKESVVTGLKNGILEKDFLELMDWLGFNSHTRESLKEWSKSYTSSEFQEILVLKIKDKEKWKILNQLPPFLRLVEEAIEGYGFVVHKLRKEEVKNFLSQFGLNPGEQKSDEQKSSLVRLKSEFPKAFSSDFAKGEIQFHDTEKGKFFAGRSGPSRRYGAQPKESSSLNFSRMVEYAIVTDKKVEISLVNGNVRRLLIRPLRIIHEDSDPKIIGTEIQSGMRSEYSLEDISSLRVIE